MQTPQVQLGLNSKTQGKKSIRDSSVRVGPMVNITRVLNELGEVPDEIFKRAGLEVETYSDPDHRVTYLHSGRLFAECTAATGCDYFGLLVGQASQPSHLGIVGFLVRTATTVGDALNSLIRYMDLHDEGGTLELNEEDGYCQMSFHIHQQGLEGIDQIYDLCAAVMYNIMRTLCGSDWTATEVFLPRRNPNDTVPYRRLFRTVVLFDSDFCGITFPCRFLDQVSPSADSLLFRHLELEAKALHRIQGESFTDILPAAVRHALLTDCYSAGEIAQQIGLSERTFHRYLRAAHTNFRAELDRERRAVSEQLLEVTSLSVCEIAQSLGYTDSSSFNRAFRRWTGNSPTEWRKNLKPNDRPA